MDNKLNFNIENFSTETMQLYGCSHAIQEHLFAGQKHMVRKLKKNVPVMKADGFIHACMFMSREQMASAIKACLQENRKTIEKYIFSKNPADLVLDKQFDHPIAYGIAMHSNWKKMHPASALHLVLQKNSYTSYRIITAYAYPGFNDVDEWYDAIDSGL